MYTIILRGFFLFIVEFQEVIISPAECNLEDRLFAAAAAVTATTAVAMGTYMYNIAVETIVFFIFNSFGISLVIQKCNSCKCVMLCVCFAFFEILYSLDFNTNK